MKSADEVRTEVEAALEDVVAALSNLSIAGRDEYVLQDALEPIVAKLGFVREVSIERIGRLDFMARGLGIAIECKVAGSAYSVAKQVDRYLSDCQIRAVVLVTTCRSHLELKRDRFRVVYVRTFP